MTSLNKREKEFFFSIKIIAFDFDDTLVDEKESQKKRWLKVLKEFKHLSNKFEDTFIKIFEEKGHKYKYLINETINQLYIDSSNISKIAKKFRVTKSESEKTFKGAMGILDLLTNYKIKKGIISKGVKSYQQDRILLSGIKNKLDFIYYNPKSNLSKIQLFKKAMLDLKINNPSELLYVGNNFDEDAKPALKLGMKVIIIGDYTLINQNDNLIYVNNLTKINDLFQKYLHVKTTNVVK